MGSQMFAVFAQEDIHALIRVDVERDSYRQIKHPYSIGLPPIQMRDVGNIAAINVAPREEKENQGK